MMSIGEVTTSSVVSSMLRSRTNWEFLRGHDAGCRELLVLAMALELERGEVMTLGVMSSSREVRQTWYGTKPCASYQGSYRSQKLCRDEERCS